MLLSKNHKRCVEISKTLRYLRKWDESNTRVPFFFNIKHFKIVHFTLIKKNTVTNL